MGRERIRLQNRDLAVLRDLFESRVMTTAHVAAIHFNGRYEAAKQRLQILKFENLIAERPRSTFERALLFLTSKGLTLLDARGILLDYPKLSASALNMR